MYSQHFGLAQDPFSIAPDPRYLFMSERHREALAHLLFGVGGAQAGSGGGFVLLTGDIGTGKTTICRCFLEQIPAGCHVAYIFNPKLTVVELLQSVCEEFHIDTSGAVSVKGYIDALNAFLLRSHAAGQSSVLIIDEAQNLAPDVLEQLRLLTNLETNERKLLQIVLIGQPELRSMVARPELEQLAQRVIARFHLDALDATESTRYIEHRLAVAGHKGALPFNAKALRRIHQLARGVPRRINLLCARALLGAWAHGQHRVDRRIVDRAAGEVFGKEAGVSHGIHKGNTALLLVSAVLLLCLGVGGTLLWSHGSPPATDSPAAPADTGPNPTPAAQSPQPAASEPTQTIAVAEPVLEDLEALLPELQRDMPASWRVLAATLNYPLVDADPCKVTPSQAMQCVRASDLTLPQLRQLDRPGILTLHLPKKMVVYANLVGLGEDSATLQIGASQHRVRLASLTALWQGDFATYWKPPADYLPGMPAGSKGAAVDWLAHQLDAAHGSASPARAQATGAVFDDALRARVRAFQRTQGLKPDGQPGPMTFMQLESAAGALTHRLHNASH